MTLRYPVLTLRRADLVAAGACAPWLSIYDDICRLRGDERAPWVRRGSISRRDPSRLRVELTPLAQVWLARDGRGALAWLRERGLMGPASLVRADLRGANLYRAYLCVADLSGANLTGANLTGAARYTDDAPISGWTVTDGRLVREVTP